MVVSCFGGSLPYRQLRKTGVIAIERSTQFTAVQAAQKLLGAGTSPRSRFTAVQAAQKKEQRHVVAADAFTAVQAAQKLSVTGRVGTRRFTAVQAAQKDRKPRRPRPLQFTAVQAAQKIVFFIMVVSLCSLPYRQLRNLKALTRLSATRSLPYRQLRNFQGCRSWPADPFTAVQAAQK